MARDDPRKVQGTSWKTAEVHEPSKGGRRIHSSVHHHNQVHALDLGFSRLTQHPATAGYTKAETTKSTTRQRLVLWWRKLSQGLNLTKMPKPSSHVTELKAHLVKGWGVGKAYLLTKTMTLHRPCWAVLIKKGMRPPLPINIRE